MRGGWGRSVTAPYPDGSLPSTAIPRSPSATTAAATSPTTAATSPRALDALVAAWPVPVTEIALVGHSMGGLVARSACHYGADGDWVRAVRDVVMLGAPHHGAPLELAANAATAALSLLPETRALARPLRARSVGVKDLGYGYVVDEDWEGHDPDAPVDRHRHRDPVPGQRRALLRQRDADPGSAGAAGPRVR